MFNLSIDHQIKMKQATDLLSQHNLLTQEVETQEARMCHQIVGTEVYLETYWPLHDRPLSIAVIGQMNDPDALHVLQIIRPITNNPKHARINEVQRKGE